MVGSVVVTWRNGGRKGCIAPGRTSGGGAECNSRILAVAAVGGEQVRAGYGDGRRRALNGLSSGRARDARVHIAAVTAPDCRLFPAE